MARTKKTNVPVDAPLPENVRVLKNGALYDDEKKRIVGVRPERDAWIADHSLRWHGVRILGGEHTCDTATRFHRAPQSCEGTRDAVHLRRKRIREDGEPERGSIYGRRGRDWRRAHSWA